MKDESPEKKKVVLVKKKDASVTMKNNNKTDEAQKKYSDSKGLCYNERDEISDVIIRSLYKKNQKALNNTNSSCPNYLYVESTTDKDFYNRFINKNRTYIKDIKPNKDLDTDDYNKVVGNVGKQCSNKDAIICLVSRNADLRGYVKEDSPWYPPKKIYGIVDMDYDKDDREIKIVCNKINEKYDICKTQLSTTNPANDVETLLFNFKEHEILSICSNAYVPYQYKDEILEYWKTLIEVAKEKSSKLGAMRKKSVNDARKNDLNENYKKNRYSLNFSNFFPHKQPEEYSEYTNCNDDEDFLLELIEQDIKKGGKKANLKVIKNVYKSEINNRTGNLLNFCRGHDLTGILSCLIKQEMLPDKSEKEIENQLLKDIMSLVQLEDFDDSDFKKFITNNNL